MAAVAHRICADYPHRSSRVAWLAVVLAALALSSRADEPLRRHEFRDVLMGTQFKIILYTADEPSAIAASRAAFERIANIDAALTDYDAESELMRLCAGSGGPPVAVSKDLFFVLSQAQDLARRSDGAFDASIGPVIRLWRRARRQQRLPEAAEIAEARERIGHQYVELNAEQRTVRLAKPRMQLDLGGIAKGFAADEAMAVLRERGITRALVAAAGDIVVSEPPPGEPGWTIGIAPPEGADKPPRDFLLLRNAAISTSGDTEQFIEIDGKRYSHIVDTKTGVGLTNRLQVTVVAERGITADSLATAVCVLGVDAGLKLVERTPGTAALVAQATSDGPRVVGSHRFDELPRGRAKQ